MKKNLFIVVILTAALTLGFIANNTLSAPAVRVAILPFQIFSGEKVDYLNEVVPANLAELLKAEPDLTVIDPQEIKRLLGGKPFRGVDIQELDRLARLTGAQFLVYGSLTKIEDSISIDARVFSSWKDSPAYKDFVEGKDLNLLIENLGNKISQHISALAMDIPPSEIIIGQEAPISAEEQKTVVTVEEKAVEEKILPPAEAPTEQLEAKVSPPAEEQEPTETTIQELPTEEPEPLPAPQSETALTVSAPGPEPKKEKPADSGTNIFSSQKSGSDQPLNITSDRLRAVQRKRTVEFIGNVVAKREDMILFSDRFLTFYNAQNKIEKAKAIGNVKINQIDRTATCKEATFYQSEQKIVLTGNPKVWQGKNTIKGDKIIIYLNTDQIEIVGGAQERVNAIIYPKQKNE